MHRIDHTATQGYISTEFLYQQRKKPNSQVF